MLGWHKFTDKKSKLMQIITRLNTILRNEKIAFQQGDRSFENLGLDSENVPKPLEDFMERMINVFLVTSSLTDSIFKMNTQIYSKVEEYKQVFEEEAKELEEEKKTEHDILNQIRVLRKLAFELQKEKFNEEKRERLYEGLARIDKIFTHTVEVTDTLYKQVSEDIKESDKLLGV